MPAAPAAAAAVLGAERRWCSTLCLSPSRLRRLRWRRARRRQKGIARRRDHLARARVWGRDRVHVGGARARAAVPPHGRVRVRIRETLSTARTRTGELQAEQPAHDGGAEQDRGVITRRLLLLRARLLYASDLIPLLQHRQSRPTLVDSSASSSAVDSLVFADRSC